MGIYMVKLSIKAVVSIIRDEDLVKECVWVLSWDRPEVSPSLPWGCFVTVATISRRSGLISGQICWWNLGVGIGRH